MRKPQAISRILNLADMYAIAVSTEIFTGYYYDILGPLSVRHLLGVVVFRHLCVSLGRLIYVRKREK